MTTSLGVVINGSGNCGRQDGGAEGVHALRPGTCDSVTSQSKRPLLGLCRALCGGVSWDI